MSKSEFMELNIFGPSINILQNKFWIARLFCSKFWSTNKKAWLLHKMFKLTEYVYAARSIALKQTQILPDHHELSHQAKNLDLDLKFRVETDP